MKTIKCKVCGREFPEELIAIECPDCYVNGAVEEQVKERERILELIDEWGEEYCPGIALQELKQKISGFETKKNGK